MTGPVPTRLFGTCLMIYVAPLAWALVKEGFASSGDGDLPPYLSPLTTVPALGAWLALCLGLYWSQRAVAKHFHWKMHEKTAATHKEDILRQSYLCALLFLAGRVGARINDQPAASDTPASDDGARPPEARAATTARVGS